LKAECDRLSLPRRRSKEDCIADILAAQPQPVAQHVAQKPQEANYEKAIAAGFIFQYTEKGWKGLNNGMRYVATLGRYAVWDATLSTTASLAAGYLGSPLHQKHLRAEGIAPEQQRLEMNQLGYRDAVEGLISQSSDPCYRVGYGRGIRDITPSKKEDLGSEAIVFEKVADGRWEANVNGVAVRIASVQGGYKTNNTGDALLVDFGIAIKESLLAIARLQHIQLLERTERAKTIEVIEQYSDKFVVNNSENGNHYIVRPNHPEVNQRCECADCHYRGAKCKHQIAVERFLEQRLQDVVISLDDLLDKPFDELTNVDWERIREPELELVAA
jgi:hypothetical protein